MCGPLPCAAGWWQEFRIDKGAPSVVKSGHPLRASSWQGDQSR
ncbi:MAG: hypothetical protein ACLUEQ_08725 [Cloacibacillus evryensis]